jgi:hypothetical protein
MNGNTIASRRSVEKSEPFAFLDSVPKGTTLVLSERIEIDARAKRMLIYIPAGSEGSLHIRPYFKTDKGTPRDFAKFVGSKKYYSGDDVVFDIPLDVPIKAYSEIIVEAKNTTDVILGYDYSLNVIIDIAYEVEQKPIK